MTHLPEFEGKKLVSAAKGELDPALLGADDDETDKARKDAAESELKPLTERLKQALGERVEAVRVSHRLTDSAACLVVAESEFNLGMQRMLKAAGQAVPMGKPTLEINPDHALVQTVQALPEESPDVSDWALVLFDQALLVEGGELEDPAAYVARVNRLLQRVAGDSTVVL